MVALNNHTPRQFTNLEKSVQYLTEEIYYKNFTLNNMVLTTEGFVLEVDANSTSVWIKNLQGSEYKKDLETYDISARCLHYLELFAEKLLKTKPKMKYSIEFNTRSPFLYKK